jgi:hypothetical protein
MTDPYSTWDAAYVLGSLSSSDRREYENHLSVCDSCRSAVGELSGMPALLTLLNREEVAFLDDRGFEPPPLRPQLLDELLDKVSRRRKRVRWVTVVAAAAGLLAVALLVALRPMTSGPMQAQPPSAANSSLTMTPVSPASSLQATIALTREGWGTHVQMTCTYREETPARSEDNGDELAMFAVGRDGTRVQLATWRALNGVTASPSGSTSMPIDQIAAVQVATAGGGRVLLQRRL